MAERIDTLMLDIGGVLLTNGWDHDMRRRAAERFGLDLGELNGRHHMTFDTYEVGKIGLAQYLDRVVFFENRSFSHEEFREFMFEQSEALPGAIELFTRLKERHRLRVVAVSNEGRELTVHRIGKFGLRKLFDSFLSSCFVHLRKPDEEIYRVALDTAQSDPRRTVYIDDRRMFVEVARGLGIRGIHHEDLETTRVRLSELDLEDSR